MKKFSDDYIKVFHGTKTFEYDLALHLENHNVMLAALKDIHPQIFNELQGEVDAQKTAHDKCKKLFTGMFERKSGNIQKGKYAQALVSMIMDENDAGEKYELVCPSYISEAINHVCKV